jgi:hypothetical protein
VKNKKTILKIKKLFYIHASNGDVTVEIGCNIIVEMALDRYL